MKAQTIKFDDFMNRNYSSTPYQTIDLIFEVSWKAAIIYSIMIIAPQIGGPMVGGL